MSENICNFCNKIFSNKSNLESHKKTAKYCIKIQEKNNQTLNITTFDCIYCNKNFNRKIDFTRHTDICKIKIKNSTDKKYKNYEIIIAKQKEEILQLKLYKNLYEEKNAKIEELEKKLENIYEKHLNEQKEAYERHLEDKDKSQKTISNLATKAIDKAGGNKIYNKYIQNLVPLTDDYLKEQSKNLQLRHIVDGPDSLAHFASTHSLRDRVICTDVARRNFVFKDENGNIIKDPKGVKITKKFVENNKDELTRLLREYVKSYYDDDTVITLKEKQELEELLLAIKYCNDPDNADSYNSFEKQFTNCFSKLMFNKNYENLELEEKE